MILNSSKPVPPVMKIRIDRWLERFGLRVRKAANLPLSTSSILHLPAIRKTGGGDDGARAILFDVGAHVGETSMALASEFPRAEIHAFEPVADIFEKLKLNCRPFPGVKCHHLALGNENGERRIALASSSVECTENQVSRLADSTAPAGLCETIRITRLDDFCSANGISRIALLKTDTEGYEIEVLKGAIEMLRKGAVQSILVEVTFLNNNPQHVLFSDVLLFLQPFDFELVGFYDHGYRQHNGQMWYTNALFARNKNNN